MKRFELIAQCGMAFAFLGEAVGECFGNVAVGDRIGGCIGLVFGTVGAFQIGRLTSW